MSEPVRRRRIRRQAPSKIASELEAVATEQPQKPSRYRKKRRKRSLRSDRGSKHNYPKNRKPRPAGLKHKYPKNRRKRELGFNVFLPNLGATVTVQGMLKERQVRDALLEFDADIAVSRSRALGEIAKLVGLSSTVVRRVERIYQIAVTMVSHASAAERESLRNGETAIVPSREALDLFEAEDEEEVLVMNDLEEMRRAYESLRFSRRRR